MTVAKQIADTDHTKPQPTRAYPTYVLLIEGQVKHRCSEESAILYYKWKMGGEIKMEPQKFEYEANFTAVEIAEIDTMYAKWGELPNW